MQFSSPHGHWRSLTFIVALRADRITAPCVFAVRSNTRLSPFMSSRFSCRPWHTAMWSFATTLAATRAQPAPRSRGRVPTSSFYRQPGPQPHRTGLRQAETLPPAGRKTHQLCYHGSSTPLPPTSVQTTSQSQDTLQCDPNMI